MINAKRILFCCNIVSKCQIQLKSISHLTCDRRDGIMRLTVCLCKNKCSFVCIASPVFQHMCRQIDQSLLIFTPDTQNRKRPFHDTGFYIFISWNRHMLLDLSLRHGKCIMSALEMIMAQDRTTNNTVFIVINIWGILKAPRTVIDRDRDNSVIFSCRMIYSSCVTFILRTKQTFRVTTGFHKFGSCDGFRIFFRFGKVDGDIDLTIFTVYCPLLIFFYTVASDIVAVLTQFIKIIRCFLRIFFISIPEFFLHLRRTRHQTVHKFCIEEISVYNAVLNNPSLYSFIQKLIESRLKINFSILCLGFCIFTFPKGIQKKIRRIDSFTFWCYSCLHSILHQFFDTFT